MTTILLVDDHPIVREGYRRLLERQPDYRIVAEAANAAEAYQAYRKVSPDIVIMDLSLPGASGVELIHHGARAFVEFGERFFFVENRRDD